MPENKTDILFEKFRVIDCLKKDDHAAVYLADHIYLGNKIILKVLNTSNLPESSMLERFKREAQILAKIDNRYIIRVLDFGTSGEFFYISFEYFPSRNMRYWIRNNSLASECKKELIIQLFKGIAHAHANNIIHRDIKPENIFISDAMELKLGDFGLARGVNDNYATSGFSVMGTPCYMSPEQVMGDSLTHSSDLFSAGIVMYELFTGHNPFLGADVNDTINKIIRFDDTQKILKIDELPEEIKEAVTGLLKKEKENRIASAKDVLKIFGENFSVNKEPAQSVDSSSVKNSTNGNIKESTVKGKAFRNYLITVLLTIAVLTGLFLALNKNIYKKLFTETPPVKTDTIYIFMPSLPFPQNEKKRDTVKTTAEEKLPLTEEKNKNNEQKQPEKRPDQASSVKRTGKLFVVCHPWANIIIDSAQAETTPLKGDIVLTEGEHWLKLVHPNYPVYSKKVFISADSRIEIKVNLDTLFGFLDCKISPWGEIYINGRLYGQTPLQSPIKLIPGDYNVVVKNTSYNSTEFKVKIQKNQTYVLKYSFKN